MVKRVVRSRTVKKPLDELRIEPDMPADQIGWLLQAARERLGLSIEDVAETTKVSPRFLAAIEASRFDEFASHVYAVGFTRAFARAVEVPADWAVDKVRELLGPRKGVVVTL